MNSTAPQPESARTVSARLSGRRALLVGLMILALAATAYVAIDTVIRQDREAATQAWQNRISIVADSRAGEVSSWLNQYLAEISNLSRDASLELYASLALTEDKESAEAQRGFIFSLLSAAAERGGFHERSTLDNVAANIDRPRRAGLAVLRADGSPLVLTTGFPPQGIIQPSGQGPSIQLAPSLEDKTPLLVFAAPIFGSDGVTEAVKPAAWVIGAKPLGEGFLAKLVQPGLTTKSAETYILTPGNEGLWRTITPLKQGGRIGDILTDPANSAVTERPGAIVTQTGYAGEKVIITTRELSAPVPWLLVHQMTAEEALSDITRRQRSLQLNLTLAGLVILAILVIVWRHSTSRRLQQAFASEQKAAEETRALSQFLRRVSNSQPAAVAAVTPDARVRFANHRMVQMMDLQEAPASGQRLDSAFPYETAEMLRQGIDQASNGDGSDTIFTMDRDGQEKTLRSSYVPLATGEGDSKARALVVFEDITDLVQAQMRSQSAMDQLVATLTRVIDARDPWSKHHAARVAEVSTVLAEELNCEAQTINTVKTAGQLVNLGKIFVPADILTKTDALSDEEFALVHQSIARGASLISEVSFEGPVAETLTQIRAHYDGNGDPKGLSGDNILFEARILALANAFVGMVSARAHRESLGFDRALDILHKEAGQQFDRRVIAALVNIMENKGGRDDWAHFTEPTEDENGSVSDLSN